MMKVIKWIKARDLSIEGTKKNFNNKIKEACENGKFNTIFYCLSKNELLMYKMLAHGNGYDCKVHEITTNAYCGYVEVMW